MLLKDIVTPLHKAPPTPRDYLGRMMDDKVHCMGVAKQYGKDYWDGDRRYGYGGYRYIEGRWSQPAKQLISKGCRLSNPDDPARILDIGCGKGFQLADIKKEFPQVDVTGIDVSEYAIENCHPDLRRNLHCLDARDRLPFDRKQFDLAICVNVLHNFYGDDRAFAINQIQRVARRAFIVVESYQNDQEFFNLECWALTAVAIKKWTDWESEFGRLRYTETEGFRGDYEFIYFE